jgi:hypothetical protein
MRNQLHREPIDSALTILFIRFDDLNQRRAAERTQSQKAGPECGTRLALQLGLVAMSKSEGARHGPFTGLRRSLENERIRRVEPDGTQQLHRFSSPAIGSGKHRVFSTQTVYTFQEFRPVAVRDEEPATGYKKL